MKLSAKTAYNGCVFEKALVILNPVSGQHNAADSERQIVNSLKNHGIQATIRHTEAETAVLDWISEEAKQVDLILAAGGDGTVTEVVNAVIKTGLNLPVMIIPLGTANGMARLLGLLLSPAEVIDRALQAQPLRFDTGFVHGKDYHFLIFCGAGYDADVIREADRQQKNQLGLFAYILAAFRQLKKRRNQLIQLELDGHQQSVFAYGVIVFNASEFLVAGLPIGPQVNPHDGVLDIVILQDPSLRALLVQLWHWLSARQRKEQGLQRVRHLRIRPSQLLSTHADGDLLGETPLEISVKEKSINLLVSPVYYQRWQEAHAKSNTS